MGTTVEQQAALQAALERARQAAIRRQQELMQQQQQQATASQESARLKDIQATEAAQGAPTADAAERAAETARTGPIQADTLFLEYGIQAQDQQQALMAEFDTDASGDFDDAEFDNFYTGMMGQTHTVESGDTLSGIAEEYTGNPDDYAALYGHGNNAAVIGGDPNLIQPGQDLEIPQEFIDTRTVREAQLPAHGEIPHGLPDDEQAQIAESQRNTDDEAVTSTLAAFNRLPPERQAQVEEQMGNLALEYDSRYGEGAFEQLVTQPTGSGGETAADETLAAELRELPADPSSPEYAAALETATADYNNKVADGLITPTAAESQANLSALAAAYEAGGKPDQAAALQGLADLAESVPAEQLAPLQTELVRSFTNDGDNLVNLERAVRTAGAIQPPELAAQAFGVIEKGAAAAIDRTPTPLLESAQLPGVRALAGALADPSVSPTVREELSLGFNRESDALDLHDAIGAIQNPQDLAAVQAFAAHRFPNNSVVAEFMPTAAGDAVELPDDFVTRVRVAEVEGRLAEQAGHPVEIRFDDDNRLSPEDIETELKLLESALDDPSYDAMWANYDTIEFNTYEDRRDSGDSDNLTDYAQVEGRTLKLNNAADDGLTETELDKQRRSLEHVRDTGEGT